MRWILGALLAAALSTAGAARDRPTADAVDFNRYVLSFNEDFDTLDVSAWGPGTRWIAHTPWNGDFGDARFADPAPGFPFTVDKGILRIEMRRDAAGRWRSGLLSSWDDKGRGFSQRYGYFEMRAKLPAGPGVWPAFWLIGTERQFASPEIDVLEYYGSMPDRFYSHVHTWDKVAPSKSLSVKGRIAVPSGTLSNRFNIYGVEVTPTVTRVFFNGRKVWETPTQPAHRQPMFILLNLAAGGGYPIAGMPDPSFMYVDYVRAYRLGP